MYFSAFKVYTLCTLIGILKKLLYMFRTVFPSITRISRLYIQHQVYVIQVGWLPASKQSTNLYDIFLMLYVQPWTPDDGRKYRPKHVEWYSISPKIVHLVGFTIEIYHDARSPKLQIYHSITSCMSYPCHACYVSHLTFSLTLNLLAPTTVGARINP